MAYPPIVQVNVNQQIAPAPSTLQRTGALVSQDGTTTAAGTLTLLTSLASLTPILRGAATLASLTWSGGTVTATASAPHGFTVADTLPITIAGATPSGYNGVFTATVTSANAFTYPVASNPGTATVMGSYTPEDVSELLGMATTFFGQGNGVGVYVLELGPGNANDGETALQTWITANPKVIYSYLVPRGWGVSSGFLATLASYEAPTSKTYFHTTTTLAGYSAFSPLMKDALVTIEAPSVAAAGVAGTSLEFSAAAGFYDTLNNNPSSAAQVPPAAFSYLYGVTPYPVMGNSALFVTLATANVNIVGTGAEGGISNTIWLYGTTMDGNDFLYWYSVDWVQINSDLNTANLIINGSNNPQAPLYYNQNGINSLQANEVATMKTAISYGLCLGQLVSTQLDPVTFQNNSNAGMYSGQVVVNAIPFATYVAANPSDYATGTYRGLQVSFTPARGFRNIVYNVTVSNFVTQ